MEAQIKNCTHQTAGVLFEVLCAVNKNEKVEEVNPEVRAHCLL